MSLYIHCDRWSEDDETQIFCLYQEEWDFKVDAATHALPKLQIFTVECYGAVSK